ncbi:MAG: SPOR domain-containing protein [Candidatus Cloacimonadota bacterium]|nr:SPOR domain-containing protein [Candidatus Cloacimonadota bacterium]
MKNFWLYLALIIFCNLAAQSSQELYWQAKNSPVNFKNLYQQAARKEPTSIYAQKSLMELGKLELLERNYEQALEYLRKIDNDSLKQKEFWLAKVYFKLSEYEKAIVSAQNFISDNKEEKDYYSHIESMYFIIAESYIKKELYYKALSNLDYLRQSRFINNNLPLLRYKIGYCHEKMRDYEQALQDYKKLKRDFPYNQYSYLAEERMLQMGQQNLVEFELDNFSTITSPNPSKAATGEGLNVYLQIGAFSTPDRAEKQGKKAMQLGLNFSVFPKKVDGTTLYIVAVGPFDNGELDKAIEKLNNAGINSFVIKRYE